MPPSSLDQEWSPRNPAHRSQHNTHPILSTVEPSHRPPAPKPPPSHMQTLTDSMPAPYAHRYRSEHSPSSHDPQHPPPSLYYPPYPGHRQPPPPYHHYHHLQPIYPPPHLLHDRRPEPQHVRTHFTQQVVCPSTHDPHLLSGQPPSRSDPDPQHSYRVLSHHPSSPYETPFPHPSPKRPHGSSDQSSAHLSPSTSHHPLPHHSSRPSTSSSHSNSHMSVSVMPHKSRHSHPIEPPPISPDQPRLYQPQPRRLPPASPDLQLPLSPRHQNPDVYPSQLPPERRSQPTMPCPPPHPQRPYPQNNSSVPPTNEDGHFNSPRLHDQHHLSMQVFPHRRNSHSLELNSHPQSYRQSRIQSLYIHESPRLQHSSDFSAYDGSVSRRHDNSLNERQQQPPNQSGSPARSRPQEDRLQYLPENIAVQTQAYRPREHLSSPMAMQIHPSYPTPTQRQPMQLHYEKPKDRRQGQTRPMESPSRSSLNLNLANAENSVGSSSRAVPPQDSQSLHRVGLHQPSQELHEHKTTGTTHQNNRPRQKSRPNTSTVEKSSTWPPQTSTAPQQALRPSKTPDAPNYSSQLENTRRKPSKSAETSQPLPPRPQVSRVPSPVNHPNPVSQARFSAGPSQHRSPPFHRTPSPSNRKAPKQSKKEPTLDRPSSSLSRRPAAQQDATEDREMSVAPSGTEEEGLDDGVDDGVIRCICSITTDDGFTIQCEICEVWQHAVCVNVPIDEVPEHYFCDRCDPLPERRRQFMEMAPQAERIQRLRLKKEADIRSCDQLADKSHSVTRGSPRISNQVAPEEPDRSLVNSPAASTSMSRVSSVAGVSEGVGFEAPGQSPMGHSKGKGKATSSNHLDKLQTTLYADNGLGLSGLHESPSSALNARTDETPSIKDPMPRKPGRKPGKVNQSKSSFSKASLDPPITCTSASHVLEADSILAQSSVDADDRYEPWRYEYTPTLKDIYHDADVKIQVRKLITQYFRSLCEDENRSDSDAEILGPKMNHAEKNLPKPLPTPREGKSPVLPLAPPVSPPPNKVDSTSKSQRAPPHAFGNTQFLPVTMTELPPPAKLTIKPITASSINLFPSLATNPFCPNFSNSLNNSSTSSLPRLITHGVFSTQPISRGSYIASLKGSITSAKKYTQDVFTQYDTLGCNKPYVKFFKSTRLANRLIHGQDLGQIDDGLVIDSRQYGNEMRFIRNGCHPNAFINIMLTPPPPRSHNPELLKGSDLSRASTKDRPQPDATESTDSHNFTVNSKKDPWSVAGSLMDRDLHLPWEVSFGVFAASDISRREEIILPWDWDDQHLVHLLPRLLSHSSTFELQQQHRSPPLPPVRSQFLPWSMNDLRLLSRKLAAVTLTLFGLMFCGCEKKKSCAINLMWKVGCLSAGEPMFPNNEDTSSGNQQSHEILPIPNLKERQEMNLPLTFEEKFRLVLYSFLEQPTSQLTSKVSKNLNPNVVAPSTGRQRKHKIDLGPLPGLRRDWWNYAPGEQVHAQTSHAAKVIARKQKRSRSRSVLNRNTSVNKIRRVSDIGEIRRHGLSIPQDNNHDAKESTVPSTHTFATENATVTRDEKSGKNVDHQSDHASQSNKNFNPLPSAISSRKSLEVEPTNNDGAVESSGAISTDQTGNRLPHPIEDSIVFLDVNRMDQGKDLVDLEPGQVQESDEVFKRQISPADEKEISIAAHVSLVPISVPGNASIEKTAIENAQLDQVEEKMTPDSTADQVPSQENLPVESQVTIHHQLQRQILQTSAEERSEKLDHSSSGMSHEESIAEEFKAAEDQATASRHIHEPPFSPSHVHPMPTEQPHQLEIGPVDQPPAQFARVSESVEPLVESASPREARETFDSDQITLVVSPQDSSDLSLLGSTDNNAVQANSFKAEPMVAQQVDANIQQPSLPTTEVTRSSRDESLPIPTAEPSAQSFQSVNTAPAAGVSSSQSGFMDVDQRDSTLAKEIGDATDEVSQNLQEQESFDLVPSAELKLDVLVAPLENGTQEQAQAKSPSRMLLRSASVSNGSEFEAQDESALSHPSDESEESLLDSDASTTILGSSDEEMLSSHTPRYLNNRKRIRSKNIIKPLVRMGAVNKTQKLDSPLERPTGLANNGITRSFKPESRPTDKLGNSSAAAHKKETKTRNKTSSMSSNLECEDDLCAISSKAAPRESGTKMRLTIRSSSPIEDDTVATRPQHRPRISSTPSSSSASDPAENSPADAGVHAVDKSASPQLIASTHSQDANANQQATVTKSEDAGHPHPPISSKTNTENQAVLAPQRRSETETPKISPVAIAPEAIDLKQGKGDVQPTVSTPSALASSDPKNSSYTPSNPIHTSSGGNTCPPDNDSKSKNLDQISALQSVKPPKRISLKDYRSRKGGDSVNVNVTPIANPLVQFSTVRPPPTNISETSQRKQPPPPIIPALPPLLPPAQQSQPLLPLSPRKLELVASVLKKEDKDRTLLREGEAGSTHRFSALELPPALPLPITHTASAPPSTVVDHSTVEQTGLALDFSSNKNTDLPQRTREQNVNPSVADLEDAKVSSADADAELLEDDIDGVAIELMSNPSEDAFEDEGKQENEPYERSKTDPPPKEKDSAPMILSPDEDTQRSMPDPTDNSPVSEEQVDEINVDKTSDSIHTPTVEQDVQLPPPVVAHATSDDNDLSDCSPAPESRHREDSTTLEKSVEPVQNKELNADGSPDCSVQPRAPPKPRLSLAAYRQRLAAARSSTSEEPHPSQSSSPFLPDIDLSKVTPDSSTSRPPSNQIILVKQEQPDAVPSRCDALGLPVTVQAEDPPLIGSLQVELEPKLENATSTDLAVTSEVASELRTGDATMYFPPISPSILMAADESPRSPELKSSPSPGPLPEQDHDKTQLPVSLSPRSKSLPRISPESTPVPPTRDLGGDVKEGPTNQSTISRVVTKSPPKPSDKDPKSVGQPNSPTSLNKQSVSNRPSPAKYTSNIPHDRPQSSPSIASLPVSTPSHPLLNQFRKLTPNSGAGPSNSHPPPINPVAPTSRIHTPESSSHKPPLDQPLPPAPSSRLLMGSSAQRSPTISLSPQLYRSSNSPSSPVPTGATDLRSSPRGSSNFIPGPSRGGLLRTSNRPPHHLSSAPRASWSPESTTIPSNNDNSKSTNEAPLSGSPMMSTTNSSLPMIPSHAMGGLGRNNHPHYPLPPHRTPSFFPPMRNFSEHRTASMPIMETSGPGPPPSQFRHPLPNGNGGGVERARWEGIYRAQMDTRSLPPYPNPNRGRAKVRGTGQSYWSMDNSNSSTSNSNSNSSNNNPRNFGNGSRN